jgi:hypothetical protein
MSTSFKEFVSKKDREAHHQLKTIKKLLEKHGFTVEAFLENEDDPYVFLNANNDQLSFDGVRIYKLGDVMAFRVQKEKDTHPYGKAYPLDIENMFNDMMSESGSEKKAGEEVIEAVVDEFKRFFKKSRTAEKDLKSAEVEQEREDGNGKVLVRNNTLDYASMVGNKVS